MQDFEKYFIAINIPEPFQEQIREMKEYVAVNFKSKGALRSPAHITLHLPFRWKPEKENELIGKLQEFHFGRSFQIKLKGFACFEPRVLYVDVEPNETLSELQSAIVKHVKETLNLFNEAGNRRGFHPHVTIAFRDLKKDQFRLAWEHFKERQFLAEFMCNSFCLLKYGPGKWEVYREFALVNA
ncbi:MAG: RNA 2',3'-cyclic phosphodiesterase [Bacteroidia bacterium]